MVMMVHFVLQFVTRAVVTYEKMTVFNSDIVHHYPTGAARGGCYNAIDNDLVNAIR